MCPLLMFIIVLSIVFPCFSDVTLPDNIALEAKASASSYHDAHPPRCANDDIVKQNLTRVDYATAWLTASNPPLPVWLHLEWNEKVTVGEVQYFGATTHSPDRCFKDYKLYLDDRNLPVRTGEFIRRHGPQRIVFDEPRRCTKLSFEFLSHFGHQEPGAAEIKVFSRALTAEEQTKQREGIYYAIRRSEASEALRQAVLAGELGFDRFVTVARRNLWPSHVYTYHQEDHGPRGGLYVGEMKDGSVELKKIVDSTDGILLDADLSYDGAQVLFSWKETMSDYMQIYVVNTDGTSLKKVVDHPSNNVNPCWLPDGGIVFLSDRKPAFAYCWVTTSPILYRCEIDGSNVVRLSANYLNDFTPSVMMDGRIVYSRWEYVDRPAIPMQSLWTMNQDGTGLSGLFGNRAISPATFMEARQIPGSNRLLCIMTSHNGPCRGAVGVIDPSKGSNAQEAITNLTPEVYVPPVDKGGGNDIQGPYATPVPIDDRFYFVTKAGSVLVRDYALTAEVTLLEGVRRELGEDNPAPRRELGFYDTQPILRRSVPAMRAQVLEEEGDEWATMVMRDVYQGLEPEIARGEIEKILVVQEMEKSKRAELERMAFGFQFPVVSCGATYAPKRVWGFAKVEEDGSAHFKVPAGKPIYFIALDREGRGLQRMRTFTHLMPGERQSCVGCHADRNSVVSENTNRPIAALRAAQDLEEPDWGVTGFSYAHIVQPVLDEHCVACHQPGNTNGGLDLTGDKTDFFNVSYEYLAREDHPWKESRYTRWIPTYNGMEANILEIAPKHWGSPASRLAEIVRKNHPDEEGKPRARMAASDKQKIFMWIDLNVPYYGDSVARDNEIRGCRQFYPPELDGMLDDVARRRCYTCHGNDGGRNDNNIWKDGRIYRKVWVRVENVEKNNFLFAPLSKEAGGGGLCSEDVFKTKDDPDYQAILRTFAPTLQHYEDTPRIDMAPWRSLSDNKVETAPCQKLV